MYIYIYIYIIYSTYYIYQIGYIWDIYVYTKNVNLYLMF